MNAKVTQLPAAMPAMPSGGKVLAIVPQNWQDAVAMAGAFVRARMVPKHFENNVEMATVAIIAGLEVGLTPMASLQSIAVINNSPTIFGDGLVALVRASGYLEDMQEGLDVDQSGLPTLAWCKVKRRGEASWKERTLTQAECQRAGWWKKPGPWTLTPGRMMSIRCRGWLFRDVFADVLRGLHSAEEVQDMVDVTAHGSVTTAPAEPKKADFVEPATPPHSPAETAPAATAANPEQPLDGKPAEDQQAVTRNNVTDVADTAEIEFPPYTTAGKFYEFSDTFLQSAATTPAMARLWEEFYRAKIKEIMEHPKESVRNEIADTLNLYHAKLAEEQPA